MRDLTEEELGLAPDWATHYWESGGKIMFESPSYFQLLRDGRFTADRCDNAVGRVSCQAVEIKRKPFDISKHELNDHLTELENGVLGVNDSGWIIDKKRAIAIAKALGVTGEDLS